MEVQGGDHQNPVSLGECPVGPGAGGGNEHEKTQCVAKSLKVAALSESTHVFLTDINSDPIDISMFPFL